MERGVAKLGQKINARKTKIIGINNRKANGIKVAREQLGEVKQFCYLGSTLATNEDVLD